MNIGPKLCVIAMLTVSLQLMAQAPQGVNYQSVARNASGQLLVNQNISVQFSVHDSTAGGSVIYRETHSVLTNQFGTFSVVIGGGSIIIGNFGTINWGSGPKYLEVDMDFTGGNSYTNMGTAQLLSVPYALYANNSAGSVTGVSYDTTGKLDITTNNLSVYPTSKGSWLTTGNGSLSSVNNFIGTTDNTDLILKRGGTEGLRMATGGSLLATGNDTTGVAPTSGAGARMMWIPASAAFRAGSVSGGYWDNSNIGANSVAMGKDVLASGIGAVAMGAHDQATGNGAAAIGTGLIAPAYQSIIVGSYNDTTGSGSATAWNSGDVLFQVGNGTSPAARANAMTVAKNGLVTASQLLVTQSMTLKDTTLYVSGNFTLNPANIGFAVIHSSGLFLTTNMTLAPGSRVGQILLIEVVASGLLNGVQLNDNLLYNLSLSGLIDMLGSDTMMLIWDGTSWVELSHSSNN